MNWKKNVVFAFCPVVISQFPVTRGVGDNVSSPPSERDAGCSSCVSGEGGGGGGGGGVNCPVWSYVLLLVGVVDFVYQSTS